jgi:hypothetical protein
MATATFVCTRSRLLHVLSSDTQKMTFCDDWKSCSSTFLAPAQQTRHDYTCIGNGVRTTSKRAEHPYTLPLIISITRKKVLLVVPVYSFVDKCQTHATPHEETWGNALTKSLTRTTNHENPSEPSCWLGHASFDIPRLISVRFCMESR